MITIEEKENLPEYKGFKNYMVLRGNPLHKWYCGYVELPESHTLYDVEGEYSDDRIIDLDVHGGITWAKDHILGFDCMHWGDTIEKCNSNYVRKEIHKLIDQLVEIM